MADLIYVPSKARTDLVKLYRKVQTTLFTAFNFKCEEYASQPEGDFPVDWSAREILFPLDLNEGGGVASIEEGGKEANPTSPTLEEGTTTWIQLNKRFTLTKIAQYIDEQQGVRPMVKRQFVFQGAKMIQAIAWTWGVYFYGFGTGVQAKVLSAAGAPTYTLKDAYGLTGLSASGSASDNGYLARLFKVGDRVAVLNPTGPALRGIETVTARSESAGSITLANAVASTAASDLLVYANSIENTTLAGGTDYNKAPTGLLDVLTSASLHGLTHANWTVAFSDTATGRFSGMKLHRGKDEIENYGPDGALLDRLIMDQGVYRDTVAQYQSAIRFNDPFALEIDADIKTKRVKIMKTRKVPPGFVCGFWSKAYRKMTLFDKPTAPTSFMDGDKLENQNAMVFMADYPYQLVCTARKAFVYWLNQTAQ